MSEPAPELPRAARRVAQALAQRGHPGEIRLLDDSARTAAMAAAALGVEQRQIVKSLVFRGARSGEAVLVLVGGTSRVAPERLEAHLGEPVERAPAAWVREQTGFAIGGIPPLAHSAPIRTVADAALVELDVLWAAAGTPHAVFALRGGELRELTGAAIAAIGEPEPPPAPLGPQIAFTASRRPDRGALRGERVVLRALDPAADAAPLHALSHAPGGDPSVWTYLFDGPYRDLGAFGDALAELAAVEDPLVYTIEGPDGPLGMASYMRIVPEHGVIEIGRLWFAPALQRTAAATEAIYLLARHALGELGYRRLEWKCDALNAPSRRAALRFGFRFEGVFRHHMVVKGRNRNTAWFAIVDEDWPAVAQGFERWLAAANFDAQGRQRTQLGELIAAARAGASPQAGEESLVVEEAREATDELVAAVAELAGELSTSAARPERSQVAAIVEGAATHLLVARDGNGRVLGMLTLVAFPIPTGMRAWIEDVVVAPPARGRGVGAALNRHAVELAHTLGARTVDLTSRPSREAANRLYARLGFERRETNVYRYGR